MSRILRFGLGFFVALGALWRFEEGIQTFFGLPAELSPADTLSGLLGAPVVALLGFMAGWVLAPGISKRVRRFRA